jgi:hypothetical protein
MKDFLMYLLTEKVRSESANYLAVVSVAEDSTYGSKIKYIILNSYLYSQVNKIYFGSWLVDWGVHKYQRKNYNSSLSPLRLSQTHTNHL